LEFEKRHGGNKQNTGTRRLMLNVKCCLMLNVVSGHFGSEMVKLPEQKSHVKQISKSSLDFDFKYE